MSQVISLDIIYGEGSELDISGYFPLAETHAVENNRHDGFIDDMWVQYDPIDFSLPKEVRIDKFRTLDILDLVSQEVIDAKYLWRNASGSVIERPHRINLVHPLYVPYGAIDIRMMQKIPRERKYPDLFTRKLPYGLIARRQVKETKNLWKKHRKRIFVGMASILALSVPMLAYVGYAVSHGYDTLEKIASSRDPNEIRSLVRSARGDFERSSFLFSPFGWIPVSQIDSVKRATNGGLSLTRGLDAVAQTLPETLSSSGIIVKKWDANPLSYRAPAKDISPLESIGIQNPTDWIRKNKSTLVSANTELKNAWLLYAGVTPTGDRTLKMQKMWKVFTRVSSIFDIVLNHETDILKMLGDVNPQRYIVFNQNRDEIRANGGFPGSIITFTLYKGNILDYRTDDVYYYDWNLFPYKEIPPPGIALLTDNYGLRDVNYYPDFRDTLAKTNSFIERSGDASVTTGLAIHQWLIEDILAKVGPVSVTGVTIPFESTNFSLLMSTLVENKYAKENTPKDILFRFIEAFGKKIQEKNAYLDVLDIIEQYWQDGEILFASRDKSIDTFLDPYKKTLPWNSEAKNWIYPIWTSVSGNKSDRYITRAYEATTKKIEGCTYENSLTFQTKHTYSDTDRKTLATYFSTFGISENEDQAKMKFIQGDGKNRSFVRVFVPTGAELVGSAGDIAVAKDPDATIFSFMLETPVWATTSKSFKYRLNVANCIDYDGTVEWWRQPWIRELIIR